MKNKLLACLFALLCVSANAQTLQEINTLRSELEENLLQNILPFWMQHTVDPTGGFYGTVNIDGTAVPGAEKGSILNARILWTFSKAAELYPAGGYRELADRAADYFINHFIDPVYGGVYWSVNSDGNMKDGTKQSYATAFSIYGLAEHYRATGNAESLKAAQALYRTLEEQTHDKVKKGYIETFTREYKRADIKGVDGMAGATKTMNTHIHIIEAYTTLYQVWPDAGLRANMLELLDILSSKLYDPERAHLILYCDDDWKSLEEVDSFGHDIETSWLLCEAANTLGDHQLMAKVNAQAVKMTETALKEGLNPEGVMLYERNAEGYRTNLSWWPQCETVIGSINAWQLTGQRSYFDAAVKNWNYVKTHFVDKQYGGWYKGLNAEGKPTREAKVSQWNCPYHNSRMVYEILHRLEASAYTFTPVNPNATPEARALLARLYRSVADGKIISAIHHNQLNLPNYMRDLDRIEEAAGVEPLMWGGDLAWDGRQVVEIATREYQRGHIITLMWHVNRPFDRTARVDFRNQTQGDFSEAQWKELVTPGTEMHRMWLEQVDSISGFLKTLQERHIPVLWRPYHEMNGEWFWWGYRQGPQGFTALWKMMYDRMVNYHHLDNLLWVWNANAPRQIPGDTALAYDLFYPGNEYVDVLATDVYNRDWKQSHHDELLTLGKGKLITLGELGSLPTPEQLAGMNKFAWFMIWTGFTSDQYNTLDDLRDIYTLPQVVNYK